MSLDSRSSELKFLHPAIRSAVIDIRAELNAAGHPFEVFEAYRSPRRQRYLYAQGRTAPGKRVTKAKAWQSYHQYGLAADFVLKLDSGWSWETGGRHAIAWQALHTIGRRYGLEPLSWEMPHLQMAGLKVAELRRGSYPPGGDESWADNLEAAIAGWDEVGAPPRPAAIVERPPIMGDEDDDQDESSTAGILDRGSLHTVPEEGDVLDRSATPQEEATSHMTRRNQFARIQSYIDKWEGGYVDHPSDPGGATNMGITQATLARWRGEAVSKADVRSLSRSEQRQIMKTFYYDLIRGDELPAPIGAVVYNGAVLHGPRRSAQLLQEGLRLTGSRVAVDGAIGRETLVAVTNADVSALLDAFVILEERLFRSLKHFKTFGKGWLNRLEDVATFARTMIEPENVVAEDLSYEDLRTASPKVGDADTALRQRANGRAVDVFVPGTNDPLTKVNGAFGAAIGRVLNGRKTAIGIVGTVLAGLIPELQHLAPGVVSPDAADATSNVVYPLALGMTGWGILGKFEKWAAAASGVLDRRPPDKTDK
jgi:peptidoglycan L-alanyl-D-glutamate endopeptidase CwlK